MPSCDKSAATTLVGPSGAVDVMGDNATRRPFAVVSTTSVERQVRIVTANAIEVIAIGGPEVLKYVDKPRPSSRRGEVLIKAEAIGVNFVDTCFRSGLYPRELPCCHMAIQLNHRAAVHLCHRLTVEPGSDPAAIWPAGAVGYLAPTGFAPCVHH
jgi:hypothetical protein